eukprot:1755043-Rhodomonas_salina.2
MTLGSNSSNTNSNGMHPSVSTRLHVCKLNLESSQRQLVASKDAKSKLRKGMRPKMKYRLIFARLG